MTPVGSFQPICFAACLFEQVRECAHAASVFFRGRLRDHGTDYVKSLGRRIARVHPLRPEDAAELYTLVLQHGFDQPHPHPQVVSASCRRTRANIVFTCQVVAEVERLSSSLPLRCFARSRSAPISEEKSPSRVGPRMALRCTPRGGFAAHALLR